MTKTLFVCGVAAAFGRSVQDSQSAFDFAYQTFKEQFPSKLYEDFMKGTEAGFVRYKNTTAFTADLACDARPLSSSSQMALRTRSVAPFPGGASSPLMGMEFAGKVARELETATGPAAAQAEMLGALASTALGQVKGILQSVIATAATDIPPMVPPPAWNNRPFPCMPMVTGHNCFGAVLYPITIGDFILADTSDSALDGAIASFPSTYRSKVGRTDDETYNTCFSAYMSMQCASTFPKCSTVQASESFDALSGRAPMCFVHCIATLTACPGLWVDDILDTCQDVSIPPVCAMANYVKSAPPQLATYEEAEAGVKCPGAAGGARAGAGAAGAAAGAAPAPSMV